MADLEAVLRQHLPMLGRIAAAYEANPALREELLQETTLAIWKALSRRQVDGNLKAYIARIAHNRAVTHVQQSILRPQAESLQALEERDQPVSLPEPGPGPDSLFEAADQQSRLLAAIRQLPTSLRAVLVLALEGIPHRDIASSLGLSVGNVDVRLSRARAQLKSILNPEETIHAR